MLRLQPWERSLIRVTLEGLCHSGRDTNPVSIQGDQPSFDWLKSSHSIV